MVNGFQIKSFHSNARRISHSLRFKEPGNRIIDSESNSTGIKKSVTNDYSVIGHKDNGKSLNDRQLNSSVVSQ